MSPRHAILATAALGAAALAHGLWIPAKATLAQALLERSFERALIDGVASRPWPWADFHPVARLVAPDGSAHVVLDASSGATLAFGPGHVPGTAPIALEPLLGTVSGGTVPGNIGLAGHRDTHFAFLEHLRPGDRLHLESLDGSATTYRVTWLRIVDRRTVDVLEPTAQPSLTLVTCWPFDRPAGGDERYIVRAVAEARAWGSGVDLELDRQSLVSMS